MQPAPSANPRPGRSLRIEAVSAVAVYTVVGLSLVGFATFGLRPELIARVPGAARIYGLVFGHVGQVQVWLLFAALAAVLIRRTGWRWVPALVAVYGLTFLSEFFGTSYGVPFGGYAYTGLLGPKWLERVPVVIPVSWFCMAVPSFALARRAGSPLTRLLLASGLLVAWDLALDPAMSFLTPYWVWEESGPYYGMPWINLAGWFLTALLLFATMTLLGAEQWTDGLNRQWLVLYYGANLLMPLGMLAAAGHWPAVLTTLGAVAALGVAILVSPARRLLVFHAPSGARS